MLRFDSDMPSRDAGLITRRIVLAASSVVLVVGLVRIGRTFYADGHFHFGNPVASPAESIEQVPSQAIAIRAEVVRVSGNDVVRAGDKCEFLVEQKQRVESSLYCNAQIVCGGKLIYGGTDRGYFPCRVFDGRERDVLGTDPSTTQSDGDAAIRLDTRTGILRIWDDERGSHGKFDLEAEILSTQ